MDSHDGEGKEREWLVPLRNRLEEVLHPVPGPEGKTRLLETLAELGNLLARHRAEMPNELVHYLERRSYEKAAQWCAGEIKVHRGKCGSKG
jgi:hypothetical protein